MNSTLTDSHFIYISKQQSQKINIDCMFVMGVLSTFILFFSFKIAGISFFKYIAFGFGTYLIFKSNGIFKKSVLRMDHLPYFAVTVFSVLLILLGKSPFKEYSIRSLIDFFFIAYLCFAVVICSDRKLLSFIQGVRVSCYVQIVWSFIQIALWYSIRLDLNKLLFVDLLHLIDSASKYDKGELCISGISHHPSNLIVVVILTLFLVKKIWKWPVCVIIALASKNSTTMIAVALCMLLYIISKLSQSVKSKKMSKKDVLLFVTVLLAVFVVLCFGGGRIASRYNEIIFRVQSVFKGTVNDGSTIAHASYYTFLPAVWKNYSITEVFFGYSYGWTGGMFDYFFGTKDYLIFTRPSLNWGVESDPMNMLYGIGIVGMLAFYFWLIKTALKGKKINRYYSLMIVSFIIAGFFYCIQYSFVVVFEVVITTAICRNLDVFNNRKYGTYISRGLRKI